MKKKWVILVVAVIIPLSACANPANSKSASSSIPPIVQSSTATSLPTNTPTSQPFISSPTPLPTPTTTISTAPIVFPKIDRHPAPADFQRGSLHAIPTYNPDSDADWQVDLRSFDLSGADLRNSLNDLLQADFDDKTVWPPADRMPAGFDWKQIMKLGKNPGLNINSLHAEGITGKNIGIAIIDQTLLVDHEEYADRIQLYEETSDIHDGWLEAQMHGPGVASIAVGKTVGVAPEADLYFIATAMCSQGTYETIDFGCLANSVRQIIEINRQLPADRKIRVLSMSIGWDAKSKGYKEITEAVQKAKDAGIFVICSSEAAIYGFLFDGMDRKLMSDPNNIDSFGPGFWWANEFYQGKWEPENTLLVPMDARTTASPTGVNDYVFYREGGWSWCIPYIAGMYALAAQVKPDITPFVFWSTALQTGRTIEVSHGATKYSLGYILDPIALIHALQD